MPQSFGYAGLPSHDVGEQLRQGRHEITQTKYRIMETGTFPWWGQNLQQPSHSLSLSQSLTHSHTRATHKSNLPSSLDVMVLLVGGEEEENKLFILRLSSFFSSAEKISCRCERPEITFWWIRPGTRTEEGAAERLIIIFAPPYGPRDHYYPCQVRRRRWFCLGKVNLSCDAAPPL